MTVCMPPCNDINGTCDNNTCTIACTGGFLDCDGDHSNGCESGSDQPGTCGSCGQNCNECLSSPTCSGGTCNGTPKPDRTACHAVGCAASGACMAGACTCPAGFTQDMSVVTGHPTDISRDCSFGGGGAATSSLILLFGAVFLLFRRRRSS